jgi:hypothetical protein
MEKRPAVKPVASKKGRTQIWETGIGKYGSPLSGYFVTGDNLDDVISYVCINETLKPDDARDHALKLAQRIAKNPTAEYFGEHDVDLREFGKIDSESVMPGWVYGLWCRELGANRGEFINPNPFCRFRLTRMAMQFAERTASHA